MESARSVMAAPPPVRLTATPAYQLARALRRRGQGDPPTDPDALVGWLKARPPRLAWAVSNRPAECTALGLLERPLPAALLHLRHATLPLDPRSEAGLRAALALAGVSKAEVELALADRPHLLQSVLMLLGGNEAG